MSTNIKTDMNLNTDNTLESGPRTQPWSWKLASPTEPGWHDVVTPANTPCRSLRMFRLNLRAGQRHQISQSQFELVAGLVQGQIEVACESKTFMLSKLDGFYLPATVPLNITAQSDAIVYLGGAICDAPGRFFVRHHNANLPLGEIRQVHGKPPFERDVFMTLDPQTPASRLIAGWTFSKPGGWTSWPPHQHENDLEETYAYFDMPAPRFGLHLSYRESGKPEAVHTVSSGDFVIVPRGYHPTVALPGVCNSYFWVLAAHRPSSRRYDLAVPDPALDLS